MVEEVGIEVEGAVLEVLGSLIEVVEEMEGEDVEDGKEVEEGEREDEKVDITVPVSKEVVMVTSEEVCSTDVKEVVTTYVTVSVVPGEKEFDLTVWEVVGSKDMVVSGCDVPVDMDDKKEVDTLPVDKEEVDTLCCLSNTCMD